MKKKTQKWKPKPGEYFWTIYMSGYWKPIVHRREYQYEDGRGIQFRTKREALAALKRVREVLRNG